MKLLASCFVTCLLAVVLRFVAPKKLLTNNFQLTFTFSRWTSNSSALSASKRHNQTKHYWYMCCYELCSGKNYGYSNEHQSVDIKVLLHQNIQCIKNNYILAQAPDTQYVGYVYMTMSRSKITYNQFYNC